MGTNGKAAKVLKHLIRWLTEIETKEKECQTSQLPRDFWLAHFNYRRMMSLTKR